VISCQWTVRNNDDYGGTGALARTIRGWMEARPYQMI
jgi:hypothetical protein